MMEVLIHVYSGPENVITFQQEKTYAPIRFRPELVDAWYVHEGELCFFLAGQSFVCDANTSNLIIFKQL